MQLKWDHKKQSFLSTLLKKLFLSVKQVEQTERTSAEADSTIYTYSILIMSIFGLPLHLLQPWQTQFLCGSSDFSMLTFIARWPKNWSIPEYNICFVSVYEYINKPKCFALHKFMFPYSLAPFFNSRFRTAFDRMSGSEPAMFAILSYALSLILTVYEAQYAWVH